MFGCPSADVSKHEPHALNGISTVMVCQGPINNTADGTDALSILEEVEGKVPRGRGGGDRGVCDNRLHRAVVTTLVGMAIGTTRTDKSIACGGHMGDGDKARGVTGSEEVRGEVVAVNAGLVGYTVMG